MKSKKYGYFVSYSIKNVFANGYMEVNYKVNSKNNLLKFIEQMEEITETKDFILIYFGELK